MNNTPYILWLASWYPTKLDPFPGDFIQRHARALALYQPVHVLHIAKDESGHITKDVLVEENISGSLRETIVYYHIPKMGGKLFSRLISMRKFMRVGKMKLREIIAKKKPAFIHLHVAMRHGLLALWVKKQFGIPFIITEHWAGYNETFPKHLRPAEWFWAATKKIFSNANYFYPEVNTMGKLINKNIASVFYKPVSNCVDVSHFFPVSKNIQHPGNFNFIHVSTLSFQKNILGILQVTEKIVATYSQVFFTLAGPADEDVVKRIQQSFLLTKHIRLTGALPYPDVAKAMQDADALLMFSRYENQPCVILEALCCGLPVISTNVGGIAEVINDKNGMLLPNEDEQALYTAIESMVLSYQQYDLAAIAADAQSRYSYEKIGKQQLDYYKQDMGEAFK